MKFSAIKTVIISFLLASMIAACGGGGVGDLASGGTGGTGISYGPVTDFGSIFVNGVEFSTNSATIRRDDSPISETELRRGMVVEVQGSIDNSTTGSAVTVNVEETVRGPVEAVTGTASAGVLSVLGQTVHVVDSTLYDNSVPNFASINANTGMLLEIHGARRPDGIIVANYIERKTAPVLYSVRGEVAGHNTLGMTFSIGALTVNYGSGGAFINDMPTLTGSNNWNGLFVEVKGANCANFPVCAILTASKVERAGLSLANADKAEIEGFVTSLTSVSNFTVNAQRVVTTSSTQYSGGLQSEIAAGVKLEVEGTLAAGVLTATKVKFKDNVKIESNATVSGSTITLEGLPGVTVTANLFTAFKNTSATASNLAALNNKNVRIRGRVNGASSVIATEIEDRGNSDSNADVILQGAVLKAEVTNPTFKILGVTVDTSMLSADAFRNINDAPIVGGQSAFFSVLSVNGGLVKAKGRLPAVGDNVLAATTLREVELED